MVGGGSSSWTPNGSAAGFEDIRQLRRDLETIRDTASSRPAEKKKKMRAELDVEAAEHVVFALVWFLASVTCFLSNVMLRCADRPLAALSALLM